MLYIFEEHQRFVGYSQMNSVFLNLKMRRVKVPVPSNFLLPAQAAPFC
jgi:hypothetical protein